MDDSTSSASSNHPVRPSFLDAPPETPDVEKAISNLIEQAIPKHSPQIENSAERIRSSIARSTSVSIDGLQGLTSELQELQTFLNSEVSRVQGEIESALSGIKIIMETIAPWKSPSISPASPMRATSFLSPRIKSRDQGWSLLMQSVGRRPTATSCRDRTEVTHSRDEQTAKRHLERKRSAAR